MSKTISVTAKSPTYTARKLEKGDALIGVNVEGRQGEAGDYVVTSDTTGGSEILSAKEYAARFEPVKAAAKPAAKKPAAKKPAATTTKA